MQMECHAFLAPFAAPFVFSWFVGLMLRYTSSGFVGMVVAVVSYFYDWATLVIVMITCLPGPVVVVSTVIKIAAIYWAEQRYEILDKGVHNDEQLLDNKLEELEHGLRQVRNERLLAEREHMIMNSIQEIVAKRAELRAKSKSLRDRKAGVLLTCMPRDLVGKVHGFM